MQQRMLTAVVCGLMAMVGYVAGARRGTVVHAESAAAATRASVPKSYGRLVATIPDSIGTGMVFEDAEGVIRFVSVTGMKEGELARYDQTPVHGGIPKAYGHLVSAVVNHGSTGLVFEDGNGAIRLVTITGEMEAELTRE